MKKLLTLTFAFLFFGGLSYAQAAGVAKKPGDPIIFTWTYSVADQANATGYRLYSGLTVTGPFTFTGTAVAPSSVLTVTIPASFTNGSTATFYTIRAYFTGTVPVASSVESPDSNAVEVDRTATAPTALQAK